MPGPHRVDIETIGTASRMTVEIRNPVGQPLSTADKSNAVAESLRQIARASRFADRKKGIQPYQGHLKRDRWIPILFLVLFLIPSAVGVLYFGLLASDRYVTEARFAIRPGMGGMDSASDSSSGNVGTSSGVADAMSSQDTLIIMNYILSRPMIEALDRQMPMRGIYSRDSIDWFSRFNPARPVEWLVWYWQSHVNTEIEPTSGIVTLTVNAYDPVESHALTQAILVESERMVNEISVRAREDALRESKRELILAEQRMAKTRAAVRDLRNRDGVLDAAKSNDANLGVISQLRKTRIDLTVQMQLLLRDLSPERRQILDMKTQIKEIDENIARLENDAANLSPERRKVLADSMTQFEAYSAERIVAETYYAAVLAAYEQARIVASRQIEFMTTVVPPVVPQSPDYIWRLIWSSLTVAGSAMLFGLAVTIRRSMT